jgi:hypothetical protein
VASPRREGEDDGWGQLGLYGTGPLVEAEGWPRDARRRRRGEQIGERRRGGARGLFLWPATVGATVGICDPNRKKKDNV